MIGFCRLFKPLITRCCLLSDLASKLLHSAVGKCVAKIQRVYSRCWSGWSHQSLIVLYAFTAFLGPAHNLLAEEFLSEFEGPEISWKVFLKPQQTQLAIHQRRRGAGRSGSAELFRLNSQRENSPVRFEHPVPAATVLDELEISLWVKSSHDGYVLEAKITLLDVIDPQTKSPLTIQIAGDKYQSVNQWQQLKCRTSDRAVSDQLRLLRGLQRTRNPMSINPKSMVVERVLLTGKLPPGETDLYVDDLCVSPLVRFQRSDGVDAVGADPVVQSTGVYTSERDPGDSKSMVPVQFRLHRLRVDGKPFFPRIIPYQQEAPEVLAAAGINVAWVTDHENVGVTAPLRRQGIWVTAAPPYAKGIEGEPLDSEDASLLPFQSNTSSILFWMLGARISPDARPRLTSWTNQIRNADRRFNKRPIAADILENE